MSKQSDERDTVLHVNEALYELGMLQAKHTDGTWFHYWEDRRADGTLIVLSWDGADEWLVCEYPAQATLNTLDRFDARSWFADPETDPAPELFARVYFGE